MDGAFKPNGRGKLSRALYVARQSLRRKNKNRRYPAPRQTVQAEASASYGRHAVDFTSANEALKNVYGSALLDLIKWK